MCCVMGYIVYLMRPSHGDLSFCALKCVCRRWPMNLFLRGGIYRKCCNRNGDCGEVIKNPGWAWLCAWCSWVCSPVNLLGLCLWCCFTLLLRNLVLASRCTRSTTVQWLDLEGIEGSYRALQRANKQSIQDLSCLVTVTDILEGLSCVLASYIEHNFLTSSVVRPVSIHLQWLRCISFKHHRPSTCLRLDRAKILLAMLAVQGGKTYGCSSTNLVQS
jgi:hypothetical protein